MDQDQETVTLPTPTSLRPSLTRGRCPWSLMSVTWLDPRHFHCLLIRRLRWWCSGRVVLLQLGDQDQDQDQGQDWCRDREDRDQDRYRPQQHRPNNDLPQPSTKPTVDIPDPFSPPPPHLQTFSCPRFFSCFFFTL